MIRWRVPDNAPSGSWSFVATCRKASLRATSRRSVDLISQGSGKGAIVSSTTAGASKGGGKGGGNQSCQPIESGGTGQVCFLNNPFATYQGGTDVGQCTWYAAGMRPDLDGITTGDASKWLAEAAGKKAEGTVPVVGAIAVNKIADGGVGHVAYVVGVTNGGATLILDEANLHNDGGVFLNVSTPAADFQGYIYGGPAGSGPTTGSPAAPTTTPSPTSPVVPAGSTSETVGSITNTWTNYSTAGGTQGPSIPSGQNVGVTCRVEGYTVGDGNDWWYEIASSPWNNSYYASADAFYNNGATSGSLSNTPFVDQKVPLCPTTTPAPAPTPTPTPTPTPAPVQTWAETAGSVAHTWTNYSNAGGTEGPSISDGQTVQITCRLQGFTVSDGNTWWYQIASSPWSNTYYVSADAFYNDGATSGSLVGTPFVDTNVAPC